MLLVLTFSIAPLQYNKCLAACRAAVDKIFDYFRLTVERKLSKVGVHPGIRLILVFIQWDTEQKVNSYNVQCPTQGFKVMAFYPVILHWHLVVFYECFFMYIFPVMLISLLVLKSKVKPCPQHMFVQTIIGYTSLI